MQRSLIAIAAALAAPALAAAQTAAGIVSGPTATEFHVRIENVSTPATLRLSNGATAPAPTAPVLWLVHTNPGPLFTTGQKDRALGLETLAEDGDPAALFRNVAGRSGIISVGTQSVPVGATGPGPILPGNAYELTLSAKPGDRLTLAFMFGQSNDLFYAPSGAGIALFNAAGQPLTGDITSQLQLWDAGTEVNQEPGAGADQAPRQPKPNTGATENGVVRVVSDRYTYPPVGEVVRVRITPVQMGMSMP